MGIHFTDCTQMTSVSTILTVSQLNRHVRSWLEHEMGAVAVEGELSNLSKPTSGHLYFTLKDATAQIRCVFFRNRHVGDVFNTLQNGQHVLLEGTLSLYEARGDYQLIVEKLQEAGLGDLYRQFELLKAKLEALGLFDAKRKKPLPRFPACIGIITSATGAALRDILTTLKRRFPIAHVLLFATEVQGKQAASQICQAILNANQDSRAEVLILARGGGSIEDLWAFNDEALAYTIANSQIPIVSGIGHETDFTIADFVADLRAATPTAAAETVTPSKDELLTLLKTLESRLIILMTKLLEHLKFRLKHGVEKLTSPKQLISTYWQKLDFLTLHFEHVIEGLLRQKRQTLQDLLNRLNVRHPNTLLSQQASILSQLEHRLFIQIKQQLNDQKQQFSRTLATLHAVSPLATLDRGYAVATINQHVLMNSQEVKVGDIVDIRLAKGRLKGNIISTDQ